MTSGTISAQITDYANRADPYPLYAELRKQPVRREDDGTYLVSTYYEVRSLANDPRLSNDTSNRPPGYARVGRQAESNLPPSFIFTDPPVHDRLRDTINRVRSAAQPQVPRRPARRAGQGCHRAARRLRGQGPGRHRRGLRLPLPVTAICKVLGVPREDEPRFHGWADALASGLDPRSDGADGQEKAQRARQDLGAYLSDLIETKRRHPGPGILSALAPDMTPADLEATAVLLLVAGHETTVNAITNTTLTLLRHPDVLDRFQKDPDLAVPLVEEVLRYEPPVQFVPWTTPPWPTSTSPAPRSPKARRSGSCWPRPTAIPGASRTPTGSIRTARTTSTWASTPASTTASARLSPA